MKDNEPILDMTTGSLLPPNKLKSREKDSTSEELEVNYSKIYHPHEKMK